MPAAALDFLVLRYDSVAGVVGTPDGTGDTWGIHGVKRDGAKILSGRASSQRSMNDDVRKRDGSTSVSSFP